MGWRAAKASGNASMPVDEGGSFAQGFASTFVPMFSEATSSYLKEKQDERMLELKESLLRERESISAARTAARAATSQTKEDLEAYNTAVGVARSLGIPPTPANLREVLAGVVANDGDGSQTINYLSDLIDKGRRVFETAPLGETVPTPVTPPVEDEMSSLTLPTNPEATVAAETANLVQTPVEPEETPPAGDGVQVASLGVPDIMLSVATGDYPAVSAEAGEQLAIKVAEIGRAHV